MLAAEEKKDETLDELNKSTPKLNTMILVKNLQFNAFFQEHDIQYFAPFLIFYRKDRVKEYEEMYPTIKMPEFEEVVQIPLTSELIQFYEDYDNRKFPQKSIFMLRRKYYIVRYEDYMIHAIDGKGNGIIIYILQMNMLIKLYEQDEPYAEVIQNMAIIYDLLLNKS